MWRDPRSVLPSTANTCRRPATAAVAHSCWMNLPITVSNTSASMSCTVRRIVDSLGHRALVPIVSANATGRSATHSATATNERAPAATAHTVTVSSIDQPVSDPARLARIGQLLQYDAQGRSEHDRIG